MAYLGSAISADCLTRPQYVVRSYSDAGRSRVPGIEADIASKGKGEASSEGRARRSGNGLDNHVRLRYEIKCMGRRDDNFSDTCKVFRH